MPEKPNVREALSDLRTQWHVAVDKFGLLQSAIYVGSLALTLLPLLIPVVGYYLFLGLFAAWWAVVPRSMSRASKRRRIAAANRADKRSKSSFHDGVFAKQRGRIALADSASRSRRAHRSYVVIAINLEQPDRSSLLIAELRSTFPQAVLVGDSAAELVVGLEALDEDIAMGQLRRITSDGRFGIGAAGVSTLRENDSITRMINRARQCETL